MGVFEATPLAPHVRSPAALDHIPVRLVAVHGDGHASAAAGDAGVEALRAQLAQHRFQLFEVEVVGDGIDIAPVGQGVQADAFDAVLRQMAQKGKKLLDVRVHVAVA